MAKSKDPEIEIKARMSGTDKWKKWGKYQSKGSNKGGSGGALYFVGFLGAFVYNLQAAVGFGAIVAGILKAIIWPSIVVYKLLESFYGIVR